MSEWLDELRAAEQAATKGPWFVDAPGGGGRLFVGNRADGRTSGLWEIVYMSGDRLADLTPEAQERARVDARLIALLRSHAPALLAAAEAVERARVLCDEAERHSEAKLGRMFNGDPFPATVMTVEVRRVVEQQRPAPDNSWIQMEKP